MISGQADQELSIEGETENLPLVAPQHSPAQDVLVVNQDVAGLQAGEDGEVVARQAGDGQPHLGPHPAGDPDIPVILQLGQSASVGPVVGLSSEILSELDTSRHHSLLTSMN